jgi:hypothetical protein
MNQEIVYSGLVIRDKNNPSRYIFVSTKPVMSPDKMFGDDISTIRGIDLNTGKNNIFIPKIEFNPAYSSGRFEVVTDENEVKQILFNSKINKSFFGSKNIFNESNIKNGKFCNENEEQIISGITFSKCGSYSRGGKKRNTKKGKKSRKGRKKSRK